MFKEELEDLKNRYLTRLSCTLVFSQEHMDSPLNSGRLTQHKLGEFLGPVIQPQQMDHVFVCGPHGFNDEAEAALRRPVCRQSTFTSSALVCRWMPAVARSNRAAQPAMHRKPKC